MPCTEGVWYSNGLESDGRAARQQTSLPDIITIKANNHRGWPKKGHAAEHYLASPRIIIHTRLHVSTNTVSNFFVASSTMNDEAINHFCLTYPGGTPPTLSICRHC